MFFLSTCMSEQRVSHLTSSPLALKKKKNCVFRTHGAHYLQILTCQSNNIQSSNTKPNVKVLIFQTLNLITGNCRLASLPTCVQKNVKILAHLTLHMGANVMALAHLTLYLSHTTHYFQIMTQHWHTKSATNDPCLGFQ